MRAASYSPVSRTSRTTALRRLMRVVASKAPTSREPEMPPWKYDQASIAPETTKIATTYQLFSRNCSVIG